MNDGKPSGYSSRTRFQNPRGSSIRTGRRLLTSRRSRSPVTSTSALASNAEASIHLSSASRRDTLAGAFGFGTISYSRRNCSRESTTEVGSFNFWRSTRRSARSTTSPIMRWCSVSTCRNTSADSPRVAKALTKTFVSRKTLTTISEPHPHRSGTHEPRQTAVPAVAVAQTGSGSADAARLPVPNHFGFDLLSCTTGRGVSQEQGLVVS